MFRKIFISTLILAISATCCLRAQIGPNTTRPLTTGKVNVKSKNGYTTFLFPDFFHSGITQIGDTSWIYDCYDKDMHKINLLDLNSVDDIDHIEYFKGYYQTPRKENSPISPPIGYRKQFIYVHPAPESWMRIEPVSSKMWRYKLYKSKIARTDTSVLTDPSTHEKRKFILKYYKTELIDTDSVMEHHHHHE